GAAILLAACATPYHTPDIAVPGHYDGASISGGAEKVRASSDYPVSNVAADPWWTAFGDTGFDKLVTQLFAEAGVAKGCPPGIGGTGFDKLVTQLFARN